MKQLFFDAGPIISMIISRLGWALPLLKKEFAGTFYITPAVKRELVDRPLMVRRFEFEALEVMKLINEGVLTIYPDVPQTRVKELSALANASFAISGKPIKIVQEGEMESVVCALKERASLVIDERTLRLFIEDSSRMKSLLELRFQKGVIADKKSIRQFNQMVGNVPIIRSVELVAVAYRLGLLAGYIPQKSSGKKMLIEAVLWATKYSGCAVTEHEIQEIRDLLLKNK